MVGEGSSRNEPRDIEYVLNGPNRILESSSRRQDRLNLKDEDKDGLDELQNRKDGWNILHNDKDGLDELQNRKDGSNILHNDKDGLEELQRIRDEFEKVQNNKNENPSKNNGLEDFERSKNEPDNEVRRSNSAQDLIDYTSPIKEPNKSSDSLNLSEHNDSYKNKNRLNYEIENDLDNEYRSKDENGRNTKMYERRLNREEVEEDKKENMNLSKSDIFQNSLHRFKTGKIEKLNKDLKYPKGKSKNSK